VKLETALERIYSMHQFNIKLGLHNIEKLMKHLGNPEKKIKAIHIAGSNGKGSTASFMSSILQEAGYRIGLYTSPHLVKFNERIRINSEMIPDFYIQNFISEMDEYIRTESPTFFEITTALAFKYFAENNIDYAVIETGLGGRLDATTVLNPIASVITTISLEHTNILGDSLEQIAYEKAGIIKENINVFIGILPEIAGNVVINVANQLRCKTFELEKYILISKNSIKFVSDNFEMMLNEMPLKGNHQLLNAALSILTLKYTFTNISNKAIEEGIQSVVKNTGIQGRYEIVHNNPKVIFDAGHNVECTKTFINEFKKEYLRYSKRTLIFGAMKDKNVVSMIKSLVHFFDNIFVTNINYERAYAAGELKSKAESNNIKVKVLNDSIKFIKEFLNNESSECLVVLGSIYLLGEIKSQLKYSLTINEK